MCRVHDTHDRRNSVLLTRDTRTLPTSCSIPPNLLDGADGIKMWMKVQSQMCWGMGVGTEMAMRMGMRIGMRMAGCG